jgi:hypothetical protein
LISTAEERAGILNSSFEQSQNSVDCETDFDEEPSTPALPNWQTEFNARIESRGCALHSTTAVATGLSQITAFTRNVTVAEHQAAVARVGAARQRAEERSMDVCRVLTPIQRRQQALGATDAEPPELSTNADGNHGCYCEQGITFEGMCTHCMQCTGEDGCCDCRRQLQDFR